MTPMNAASPPLSANAGRCSANPYESEIMAENTAAMYRMVSKRRNMMASSVTSVPHLIVQLIR